MSALPVSGIAQTLTACGMRLLPRRGGDVLPKRTQLYDFTAATFFRFRWTLATEVRAKNS